MNKKSSLGHEIRRGGLRTGVPLRNVLIHLVIRTYVKSIFGRFFSKLICNLTPRFRCCANSLVLGDRKRRGHIAKLRRGPRNLRLVRFHGITRLLLVPVILAGSLLKSDLTVFFVFFQLLDLLYPLQSHIPPLQLVPVGRIFQRENITSQLFTIRARICLVRLQGRVLGSAVTEKELRPITNSGRTGRSMEVS